MKKLLQISASIFSANGQSSRLANEFVASWQHANPGAEVRLRDLGAEPVPHLTAERFAAFRTAPDERTAEQRAEVALSDALINEIREADVVVLGLPMYNFGVPSGLKAYFDHIARAGITFRYTESGPEGLLKGKKVYVFAARGGQYVGTPMDTQTAYVRDFLGFLGLTDIDFVYAEGLNMGEEKKQAALASANAAIERLAAPLREAA